MAEALPWDEGTVWLKGTDKDGGVTYTEHRCWHVRNFLKGVFAAAVKNGGTMEQITEAEFQNATKRR